MRCVASQFIQVAFLFEHDFVNEATHSGIANRNPRGLYAGQALRERLDERHEIPNREDVMLHEPFHHFFRTKPLVDLMFNETLSKRR